MWSRVVGVVMACGSLVVPPAALAVGPQAPVFADPQPLFVRVVDAGNNSADGLGVATAPDGSTVLVGSFRGGARVGAKTLRSTGQEDGFVAAYRGDGSLRWAARIGGAQADAATAVAIGRKGDVYVVGYYTGTARFGSTVLRSTGTIESFVARYSETGSLRWVRSVTSQRGTNQAAAVALDQRDRPVVVGHFQGVLRLVTTAGTRKRSSIGWKGDGYAIRMTADGRGVWVRSVGLKQEQTFGTGVAVDSDGDAYATFRAWDSEFGGNFGMVAKYARTGKVYWTTEAVDGFEYHAVAVDPAGDAVVAGVVRGWHVTLGAVPLTSNGASPILVVKHASHGGAVVWAAQSGGDAGAGVRGLGVAADGSVVVGGTVNSTLTVGPSSVTAPLNTAFLAGWTGAGAPAWAALTGPVSYGAGEALAGRPDRSMAAAGSFTGSVTVGTTALTADGTDAYVVRWGPVTG